MEFANFINEASSDDPDLDKKCSVIAERIQSGQFTIIGFLEQLEGLLTNSAPSKREVGIILLNEVLKCLPLDFLNSPQVLVIVNFYTGKLKDHHQVVPAVLRGILEILEYDNFPKESIPLMLTSLFQNISCQQQQQHDRYNIYSIFQVLLDKYAAELKAMGADLVYGLITFMEGESDPRNLLFLFKWMKIFLKTVPLGHLAEEMFDVLACYFPIDFKVSPKNAQITRENLAEALCPCLCAIPEFGCLSISLALEKLDSSLDIAKLDSLDLLEEGCKHLNASSYAESAHKIWAQLHKEIFTTGHLSFQNRCLCTLTVVIRKISQGPEDKFKCFLHDVLDMLKRNLFPDTKHCFLTAQVFIRIASGSEYSSRLIMKEVSPVLINTFSICVDCKQKAKFLECLTELTVAFLKNQESVSTDDNDETNDAVGLCFKALLDISSEVKAESLRGFSRMLPYLPPEARTPLYVNIRTLLLESTSDSVRESLIKCLRTLAVSYERELRTEIIDKIEIDDPAILDSYLNALCALADLKTFRETVVDIVISCVKDDIAWTNAAVKNIKCLLEKGQGDPGVAEVFFYKNTIQLLLGWSLECVSKEGCHELLLHISSVLKLIMAPQVSQAQTKIFDDHLGRVLSCMRQSERYIFVLSGLICGLRQDVVVDGGVLEQLFRMANGSEDERVKDVAVQLLANLINKRPSDESFVTYLDQMRDRCLELVKQQNCNAIVTLSWITKALFMRNFPQFYSWLDALLDLVEQNEVAAEGFRLILDNNCALLSRSCHCTIMLLYRQKVFVYVTNKLMDSCQLDSQLNLKVFGYILEYSPEEVILVQFKKISRIVLLCLEKSNQERVLIVLLQTINKLISMKNEIVEEHLEDFLTRILRLTSFENSMKVRMAALKCLNILCSAYPLFKLLPFKAVVLTQLSVCVDDKKRLVRKEAMETRSLWFLLDALV